jgi:hypothetical protein
MTFNHNYVGWACELRRRYRPQFEAEEQAEAELESLNARARTAAADSEDVARERDAVAKFKVEIAAAETELRLALQAEINRVERGLAARELASIRSEFPELLPVALSPAQQVGRVTMAHRESLPQQRARMAAIAERADEKLRSATTLNNSELRQDLASLTKAVEELSTELRTRHLVRETVLRGLMTTLDDAAFRQLITQLSRDAELESAWQLEPDIIAKLTELNGRGGP